MRKFSAIISISPNPWALHWNIIPATGNTFGPIMDRWEKSDPNNDTFGLTSTNCIKIFRTGVYFYTQTVKAFAIGGGPPPTQTFWHTFDTYPDSPNGSYPWGNPSIDGPITYSRIVLNGDGFSQHQNTFSKVIIIPAEATNAASGITTRLFISSNGTYQYLCTQEMVRLGDVELMSSTNYT